MHIFASDMYPDILLVTLKIMSFLQVINELWLPKTSQTLSGNDISTELFLSSKLMALSK